MFKNNPKLDSDIKSIYSKPVAITSKSGTNVSVKKRKKGRGFPSQAQVQPPKMKKLMTTSNGSFSKNVQKMSTSRFSREGLIIPVTNQKLMANQVLPIYQNINEENFKSHLVMEGHSKPNIGSQISKTERAKLSYKQNRKGRGSVGNLLSGLPASNNTNHHYGMFFNTNSTVSLKLSNLVKFRIPIMLENQKTDL